jgi:hypothetical protein
MEAIKFLKVYLHPRFFSSKYKEQLLKEAKDKLKSNENIIDIKKISSFRLLGLQPNTGYAIFLVGCELIYLIPPKIGDILECEITLILSNIKSFSSTLSSDEFYAVYINPNNIKFEILTSSSKEEKLFIGKKVKIKVTLVLFSQTQKEYIIKGELLS